jgi:gliding motility-associated-like protein
MISNTFAFCFYKPTIMRSFLKGTIVSFLLLMGAVNAYSYIAAADLRYECQGNNFYTFYLDVYVECGGLKDGETALSHRLFIESENLGIDLINAFTVDMRIDHSKTKEIALVCQRFVDEGKTDCKAGGVERGMQRFTYVGTKNFSQLEKTNDWRIHWTKNFRSKQLNTINNTEDHAYYVETFINNKDFTCNSSPVFNNTPTVIGIVGEENIYNPQITDADGDELRFEIADPRLFGDVDIPYLAGYSKEKPFSTNSPISIDQQGVITFTPTEQGEISIVDVLISEYRDNKLVGKTSRAIQINTFDDANNVPELTGFNGEDNFTMTYCVGQTITAGDLFIMGSDVDAELIGLDEQKISFEVRVGKSNKTFSSAQDGIERKLNFNWTFSAADVGENKFSITVKDDGCPISREVTKDYTIFVNPRPEFSLGVDFVLPCDNPGPLAPAISGGTSPLEYVWGNWESVFDVDQNMYVTLITDTMFTETSASITVNKPQLIGLSVKDALGCVKTDFITLNKSMTGDIGYEDWCFGEPTTFNDSVTSTFLPIKTHEWHFEENTAAVEGQEEETYTFLNSGQHKPFVIVEDDRGCIDTFSTIIYLCVPPKFVFSLLDTCNNAVHIKDFTNYGLSCNLETMFSSPIDAYHPQSSEFKFSVKPTVGDYPFTIHADLESGCVMDTIITLDVLKSPLISFFEGGVYLKDFAYNCDDPDSTIRATLLEEGNGDIIWDWERTSAYDFLNQVNDSTYVNIEQAIVIAEVTDVLGCKDEASVRIINDISPDFTYDIVCELGQPMQFNNTSVVGLAEGVIYQWRIDDGPVFSMEKNPSHQFIEEKDYEVTLRVTDKNGCSSSKMHSVFYSFPKGELMFTPDLSGDFCAKNDILTAIAPTIFHLDSIVWDKGDGQIDSYPNGTVALNQGKEIDFTYNTEGNYEISLDMMFNENLDVAVGERCLVTYEDRDDQSVTIKTELNGTIVMNRLCVGDSAQLVFNQTSGNEVTTIHWQVFKKNTDILVKDIREISPVVVFDEVGELDYTVLITDTEGCDIEKTSALDFAQIKVQSIHRAFVEIGDTACANEFSQITIRVDDDGEVLDWYVRDQTTGKLIPPNPEKPNDTIIGYTRGDAGGDSVEKGLISYKFNRPGDNKITIYMVGRIGAVDECRSVVDTSIFVAPIPNVEFTVSDPVCAGDSVTIITNKSTIDSSDEIQSYLWDFGGGATSIDENPEYVFQEGGFQMVSLTVKGSKCSNADTSSTSVYVKHVAKADFIYDVTSLEAYIPISFTDNSTSESEIVSYFYDFGNGVTSDLADVDHEYDTISVYQVKHIVATSEGCRDTVVKTTDLNTYLDVPTAFSPNGDGNNDLIGLIHKSIKNLTEYKIYNRWGQVVFDGGDDPELSWDGTFNGSDQEMGVYVVIVKGTGAYDTLFEFKKNITLLR